jgi:hypothetical protein
MAQRASKQETKTNQAAGPVGRIAMLAVEAAA